MNDLLFRHLLLAFVALGFAIPSFAEDRALLIGVNQYQDPQIPLLGGATTDLNHMREIATKVLHYQQHQIKTLQDTEATKRNILEAFSQWLVAGTRTGDQVLVYFTGHGYRMPDQAPFDESGSDGDGYDEALAPYDVRWVNDEYEGLLLDDETNHALSKLEAKGVRVLFIADACHSGTTTRSGSTLTSKILPGAKGFQRPPISASTLSGLSQDELGEILLPSTPLRTVWSAAASGQLTYVEKNSRPLRSVFTGLLYDGLIRKKVPTRNGMVSNKALLDFISKGADTYCKQHSACFDSQKTITPSLSIHYAGRLNTFSPNDSIANNLDQKIDHLSIGVSDQGVGLAIVKHYDRRGKALPKNHPRRITLNGSMRVKVVNHTPEARHLLLLGKQSDGTLLQLYPNPMKTHNVLSAGQHIFIPRSRDDGYTVRHHEAGDSELIAILSDTPIDLQSLEAARNTMSGSKDIAIRPLHKPGLYLELLAVQLQSVLVKDAKANARDYRIARLPYFVAP